MMKTFETISDAREGIMDLPVTALPENLQERFRALRSSPSPVDQIVGLGEFLYANRADLPADFVDVAAGLVAFATANAWHGLLEDNRGNDMVQVLRRDMGEKPFPGTKFPTDGNEPDAKQGMKVEDAPAPAADPAGDPAPAPAPAP